MKIIFIVFVCSFLFACRFHQDPVLLNIIKHKNEYSCIIETLIKNGDSLKLNGFINIDTLETYSLKSCSEISKIIKTLQQSKLLHSFIKNGNAPIYYSNKDCITIFVKQSKGLFNTTDYLLSSDYNEGTMMCGIMDLYSVNQNENISKLNIEIINNETGLNLIKITYDTDYGL